MPSPIGHFCSPRACHNGGIIDIGTCGLLPTEHGFPPGAVPRLNRARLQGDSVRSVESYLKCELQIYLRIATRVLVEYRNYRPRYRAGTLSRLLECVRDAFVPGAYSMQIYCLIL